MLVLSRFEGEEILIGDNIRISVQTIQGDRVRIGVEAPRDMSILRKELLDRKSLDDEGDRPVD